MTQQPVINLMQQANNKMFQAGSYPAAITPLVNSIESANIIAIISDIV